MSYWWQTFAPSLGSLWSELGGQVGGATTGAASSGGSWLGSGAGLLGAAAGVAGGLFNYGQYKSNAKLYGQNATAARASARNSVWASDRQYEQLASSQKAAYGASGLDVNEGSALDVMAATDAEARVNAMQLLYAGEVEAYNWKLQQKAAKQSAFGSLFGSALGLINPISSLLGG